MKIALDSLGRVVIPKSARILHNIYPSGLVEFYCDGEGLALRKVDDGCAICDGVHSFDTGSSHKGRKVCGECWIGLVLIAEHSAIRSITGMT